MTTDEDVTRSPAMRRGPRIIITPPRRWSLPPLERIWEAREILYRFAARDVTLRYRQTALGVVWVVLQPLLGAGVLSFIFNRVARLPSGGIPPIVYTFAGLMAWNVFSGIVTRGSSSLVQNATLVSKVFFPRTLVPISTIGSVSVDFCVSFAFFGVLLAIYHILPGAAILLTPVWLILIVSLAAGIALVTSALMVSYRDVAYVVPFVLQILLYASPIAYSIGGMSHRYRLFFNLNPLTWLLADLRWSLLHQPPPSLLFLCLSIAVPLMALLAGAMIFQQMERGFADVI